MCVIGAGASGLATAKIFLADGFDVDVFEKQSDLGGTWHPERTYPDLRTNDPRDIYSFSDAPYPDTADEYPTAHQVREYLHSYTDRFGLRAHMRFGTEVVLVARIDQSSDDASGRFRVTTRTEGQPPDVHTYDSVVVCNGVFSDPKVPHFDGQDRFDGRIVHSSEVTDRKQLEGRRVVVVGGGKSAYDLAEAAARHARSCTLVFRSAHWLAPRYLMGVRNDWLVRTRVAQALLPYHTKHGVAAVLQGPGRPLVTMYWRLLTAFLRHSLNIPDDLDPRVALPVGFQDIGAGVEVYDEVRAGRIDPRRAEIDHFVDGETIQLDTGETVDADLVVCATGWTQHADFLDPALRRKVRDDDGFFTLYRHILPPRECHLGFVGYAASIGTTLASEVAAHWLAAHFRGRMALPDPETMEEEIAKVKHWAATMLPKERDGHAIAVYLLDYLDQLLGDMNVSTRRADNWFAEHFTRIHAKRYGGLQQELRAQGPRAASRPG